MRDKKLSRPPKTFNDFVARYPELGQAWEMMGKAGAEAGPLNKKTVRLIKLALSIGARLEGAVHADVKKALNQGASKKEIEQVVALAASTIGLPATVASFSWMREIFKEYKSK